MALCRLLDRSGRFEGSLNGLQLRLLSYFISQQERVDYEREEERYKAQVLLHRPDIYQALYGEPDVDDEAIEQIIPETEGDVQALLRQLQEVGAIT